MVIDLVRGEYADSPLMINPSMRGVKPGRNRVRADDGDGPAHVARRGNETRGLPRGVDLGWIDVAHNSNSSVQ